MKTYNFKYDIEFNANDYKKRNIDDKTLELQSCWLIENSISEVNGTAKSKIIHKEFYTKNTGEDVCKIVMESQFKQETGDGLYKIYSQIRNTFKTSEITTEDSSKE